MYKRKWATFKNSWEDAFSFGNKQWTLLLVPRANWSPSNQLEPRLPLLSRRQMAASFCLEAALFSLPWTSCNRRVGTRAPLLAVVPLLGTTAEAEPPEVVASSISRAPSETRIPRFLFHAILK